MTIGQYAKVQEIPEERGKVIQMKFNFLESLEEVISLDKDILVGTR